MVKKSKRTICSKIILRLFLYLIILFSIILIMLTIPIMYLTTEETYYRLNNYVYLTSFDWRMGEKIQLEDDSMLNFGIIQGEKINDVYVTTPDKIQLSTDFPLENEEIESFLSQIIIGNNIYITKNKISIYYSFSIDESTNNFIIVFVDDTYSSAFVKRLIGNNISIIAMALVMLSTLIYFWISRISKRIVLLQDHIVNMNKNKYEKEYLDAGDDEIRELSESIENMRIEIKDSEITKREILQNVSHDFKTPISVIKNYAEAIVDGVVDISEAEIIIKQADILKSKVNQLLQYNRLEYLNKDNPFEEIDMADICKEVVNNLKFNSNVKFELNLDSCVFEGYRENYVTIVENILDNALRYAKSKIVIETKQNKMTIYNDGEPIEDKFLNANFKPYEKGSRGEFGLGMSIVQKTIDFFGLKLKIYNETEGVSFVIYKEK